jgi:hypothetical protein
LRIEITFESDDSALASLDHDGLVAGLVALELGTEAALGPDEALLAAQHEDGPIHQVEVVLANVVVSGVDAVRVGVEVTGALGREELAVVGPQRDGPVLRLPEQVEQTVGGALVLRGLDPTSGLETPVAVLHRAHVPALRRPVELELEGLVTRVLVLVGRHVDTCRFRNRPSARTLKAREPCN